MKIDYKEIYDTLYNVGYHAKAKNHGVRLVPYLVDNYEFKTVLDAGCSNGMAVKAFNEAGKEASGLDVSNIAIRLATEKYEIPRCYEGSVLEIPFKHRSFDAVFSCDMLEHVHPEDLGKAIFEVARVARRYLFLHLCPTVEGNREFHEKARQKNKKLFKKVKNLHLSVYTLEKWTEIIEKVGHCRLVENHEGLLVFEKCFIPKT